MDSLRFSNANLLKPGSYQGAGNYDDDMCQMDDEDDIFAASSVKANPLLAADDIKVPSLIVILSLFLMFHD